MYRKLCPEDRALFLEMQAAFNATDAMLHPTSLEKRLATFAAATSGGPDAEGFVLEIDGQPAGYAVVSKDFSTDVGGRLLWIEEIYIRPAFQGRGLGRQFLSWLEARFAGRFAAVRLEVAPGNPRALALYKELGFQQLDYIQLIKPLAGAPKAQP